MHNPAEKNVLIQWEIAGTLFVVVVGCALHFVYDWTGQWHPIALIAAVNESVWEHLKLAFWPYLIFAAVEYPFARSRLNNFGTAKAAGLLLMPLVIVSGFYGYTALAGTNYLPLDIGLFVVAVIIGHAASYVLMTQAPVTRAVRLAATAAFLVELAAFSLFTFHPPRLFLFEDARLDHYGIPAQKHSPDDPAAEND